MASFDFVDTTAKGYMFVWSYRKTIAKLAFIPFFIKFVSYVVIFYYGLEQNLLRAGLILLPTYFIDGWMIVHCLRLAFLPNSQIAEHLNLPAKGGIFSRNPRKETLMSALLIYVLFQVVYAFFVGLMGEQVAQIDTESYASGQEPDALMFFVALGVLTAMLWLFRLAWLHVPILFGSSVLFYCKKLRGLASSLFLLAAWMLAFFPLFLITLLSIQVFADVLSTRDGSGSSLFLFASLLMKSLTETGMIVLTNVVLAYGIAAIFFPKKS